MEVDMAANRHPANAVFPCHGPLARARPKQFRLNLGEPGIGADSAGAAAP
jgi:hypothetical protein